MTAIKGGTPMPLRNYKLEHDLIGWSLPGFVVQQAIFDEKSFLSLNISSGGLFV